MSWPASLLYRPAAHRAIVRPGIYPGGATCRYFDGCGNAYHADRNLDSGAERCGTPLSGSREPTVRNCGFGNRRGAPVAEFRVNGNGLGRGFERMRSDCSADRRGVNIVTAVSALFLAIRRQRRAGILAKPDGYAFALLLITCLGISHRGSIMNQVLGYVTPVRAYVK